MSSGAGLGGFAATARHIAWERKKRGARRVGREREVALSEVDDRLAPDELIAVAEYRSLAAAAVLELAASDQRLVLQRYFDGLSTVQIASQMGLEPATVRQRLSRAVGRLKAALESKGSDARSMGGPTVGISGRVHQAAPPERAGTVKFIDPIAGSPAAGVEWFAIETGEDEKGGLDPLGFEWPNPTPIASRMTETSGLAQFRLPIVGRPSAATLGQDNM